jgi:hypothetical protein
MKKISILFLCIVLLACKKKKSDCAKINFTNIAIENESDIVVGNADKVDLHFIINTKEDYNKKIALKTEDKWGLNAIDFSKQTLIIGKKKITAVQGQFISSEVVNNCDESNLVYRAKFKNGSYQAIGLVIYGAIIPKYEGQITSEIEISK